MRDVSRRASPPPLIVTEEGKGEPVLLLHGLGGSGHVWGELIALGKEQFRFLHLDLPNHGRATSWAKMTPREVALRIAERFGYGEDGGIYVVGHSFGGVVALELAAIAPKLVRGVLVAAAPAMGLGGLKTALSSPLADWTMRIASLVRPSAKAVRTYVEFIWGVGPKPSPGAIQGYLFSMEAAGHHDATLTALRSLAEYVPPAEALKADGVPVQLVYGDRDRLVPLKQGEALSRALGAPLRIVRGAGHCLPEERPETIYEHLLSAHGIARAESA